MVDELKCALESNNVEEIKRIRGIFKDILKSKIESIGDNFEIKRDPFCEGCRAPKLQAAFMC